MATTDPTLTEPERRLCAVCGHLSFFHRANTVDQVRGFDDPVPCFAVVDRTEIRPETDRSAATYSYRYCGCRTVLGR